MVAGQSTAPRPFQDPRESTQHATSTPARPLVIDSDISPAAQEPDVISLEIMMPFYGAPELFKLAVESVLNQTNPNWRLTIVDDVYPDRAPGLWAANLSDNRVRYVRNSVNLGVGGNFSKIAEITAADFVVIMGCDDILLPNYVERVSSLIRRYPNLSYLQPGVEVIDGVGMVTRPLPDVVKSLYRPNQNGTIELSGETLARSLLRGNWTYFPSICWRAEVLKRHGFRTDLDVVLDLALQIDICMAGGTLVVDDTTVFYYRRHNASVSSWSANDGTRFDEERSFFLATALALGTLGWHRASRAARFHFSSRLNAASRLVSAIRSKDRRGLKSLLHHVFRNS